ncbi:MAG TPA: M28 family peptidase [Roseiflexaceae bacterium]|nr:M28 family peptidase [Roseiflexaceae bacterium]
MFQHSRRYAERAYAHIQQLSVTIGPRPSAGEGERAAADYAAGVLRRAGLRGVRLEPFRAPVSTYAPYRLVFGAALLGSLAQRTLPERVGALAGAALSALAAWGFFAEADLRPNWTGALVRHSVSQNVVGVIPARAEVRRRVVVYGHLDTHRTPLFYSSPAWLRWFSRLIGAGFVSLGLNTARYGLEALADPPANRLPPVASAGLGGLAGALQLLGLALTTQADLTAHTRGANDNASGAATALALGERLAHDPLRHTEVWVVATGCEEVGARGMAALLERHGQQLRDALLVGFDMVGIGQPALIPAQGLLRRRPADARLLEAARIVGRRHPELGVWEHPIDAFDDSYMVARLGFRGMTVDAEGRPGAPGDATHKHWHRTSDTIDKISRDTLEQVHRFAWALLHELDT